jgi:hypothetical protein
VEERENRAVSPLTRNFGCGSVRQS